MLQEKFIDKPLFFVIVDGELSDDLYGEIEETMIKIVSEQLESFLIQTKKLGS